MALLGRLPFPLGRSVSGGAATFTPEAASYDFAVGGQAFISATSEERPYLRSLVPIRKEQFDNSREPGEQTLADWWLRNQSTFIGGEGILFQDPDQISTANLNNRHTIQYGHSVGLNPWINGQLTLLKATSNRISDGSGNPHLVFGWDNAGSPAFYAGYGTNLKSDDGTSTTTVTWGGAGTIVSLTGDGTKYYAADSTGIYSGTGTGAGSKIWNTGSVNTVAAWVKGRLMAGIGASIYELVGGAPPTLPTAKFTHLNASWKWTSFAEGTGAIFASGYAGASSAIYKFALDTSGNVPTLASGGIQACQLPLGEIAYSLNAYLGNFIGIGTNRGFRVGQIDENGDIVYGPLIPTDSPVKAIAAYDRFFFFGMTNGIDTMSGLCRVDLGQPIYDSGLSASLRFAYATDLQVHTTGEVSSVTNFGSTARMVVGVVSHGSYLEEATTLEPTGYLTTGRVRYSTLEPKIFKFLTVRTVGAMLGSVTASVVAPDGTTTSVIANTEDVPIEITDIALPAPNASVEWLQLRLDLARSATSSGSGPLVAGWQFKALPGSIRQRQFIVPLLCFDRERDHNGQWDGYEGRTLDRVEALEALAQRGDAVSFQDVANQRSYLCLIADLEFRQSSPPGENANGYGGYLTLQLRTIADVVSTS